MWKKWQYRHKVLGCSNCFLDVGLRKVIESLGKKVNRSCPSCGSSIGAKFTKQALDAICSEFFVQGSVFSGRGWFAPLIQFNQYDRPIDEIGGESLRADIRRLSQSFGVRVFLYGPPLWMFGKPPEEDGSQAWTDADFQTICDYHHERTIGPQTQFFRVQKDIKSRPDDARFCSPPDEFRTECGRFDSPSLPVHYCSLDVETCLHESRVKLSDDIFVATLRPREAIKLLDLSSPKSDVEVSPFDDPRIWLRSLIYDHASYETCQRLAAHIYSLGYQGFIVESFFQQAAKKKHLNLCIFGRPVVSGSVLVEGINRVSLRNISFEYGFGPGVFDDELFEEHGEKSESGA